AWARPGPPRSPGRPARRPRPARSRTVLPSVVPRLCGCAMSLKILQQEDINFLLTNRIPRRLATRWMGWFSKIENPLLARASIAVWRLFADLDLSDARQQTFASLHACFTRALKPGAR